MSPLAVACTALLSVALPLGAAVAVPPLPAHQPLAERELFPFDPVILIGTGEKLEGAEARESVYGNYRYRFATDASKRAFDAVPSRFAIAFGGGCGRMGPLSGVGSVNRFEVVDEHIYLFASDACRESFMKSPEAFMEHAEEAFPSDARGLELATAALGGGEGAALDLLLVEAAVEHALECESESCHGVGVEAPSARARRARDQADLPCLALAGPVLTGPAAPDAAAGPPPRLPAPSAASESSISERSVRGNSARSSDRCLRKASIAGRSAIAASTSGFEPLA